MIRKLDGIFSKTQSHKDGVNVNDVAKRKKKTERRSSIGIKKVKKAEINEPFDVDGGYSKLFSQTELKLEICIDDKGQADVVSDSTEDSQNSPVDENELSNAFQYYLQAAEDGYAPDQFKLGVLSSRILLYQLNKILD